MVGFATDKGLPVPTDVPPHEPVYHLTKAPDPIAPPAAVRDMLPDVPEQKLFTSTLAPVGAVEAVLTVTRTDAVL